MSVRKVVSANPKAHKPVRWEAMAYVNRKQVTKRFDTKLEASVSEGQMRSDVAAGRYIRAVDSATPFAVYAEQHLTHARVADSTLELYRAHLRRHILPALGTATLGSLRRSHMVAFVTDLSQSSPPRRCAPSTASPPASSRRPSTIG